jgi:putative phosphoribosyl transferase
MMVQRPFADRGAAGRALSEVLAKKALPAPVVLALPRGGVAVAAEIARALAAPIDVVLVRKIGAPFQPELAAAAAAVVDGGAAEIVTNDDVVEGAAVSSEYISAAVKRELKEIAQRRQLYLQGRAPVPLEGRTIILVDDGVATGASVRAALKALRKRAPKAVILAVPVAPAEAVDALRGEFDEIVCLMQPDPFVAVGRSYLDFHQVSDAEVVALLVEASADGGRGASDGQ